ncbi:hypothetical protein Kpol_1024p37 [Vanderwaltozyma polyspora DSM 70294]|uniref:Mediator of RNA polymerase II transcription subunit 8 n=1 Tax=Vanderwaltozyma polyspora (strain ATCC 22028 / DSM 70294 / BCRC 21397 / CBS 2163 / NBRC 10782 / NRRL Y-8283 / UCD 57-17) TaxID=436907 RepID=A7TLJ7_VANPO|nr:uncharacterized protein Kpol_1024p37 [Vanderwaltozyma polyspora DSM 70294]EDO16883.1 hypothetical protein Kpol_1024p37 [Vanderwaltozyma polyspora DSM 70294]
MSHADDGIENVSSGVSLQDEIKPNFNGVPAQALDAVRMRLAQLTHSLKRIRDELARATVPQWYTLQSQLNVTLSQLMSVTSTLQHFQDTLDSTVVYPLPSFPTTSHEGLLTTLLRKKNIPEVDDWLAFSKDVSGLDLNILSEQQVEDSIKEDREATKWALTKLVGELEKYDFKNLYYNIDENNVPVRPTNYFKPKQPFDINSILGFTYKGEGFKKKEENSSTKNEEDVIMV